MRLRAHLLVYAFYFAVAIVVTYPLITVIGTRMIGHPFGDAYEYAHHIWWIKTALQTGQDPFFQPIIAYPDGASAVLLWSLPLQSFPAWLLAFVLPLPAAFNLSALLTLALNGWAMFFLARSLTKSAAPAILAGLVFMLYPAFQGQIGAAHVGLLTLYPAALYVYMLFRLKDARRVWLMILAGALLFAVSLWGSVVLLIYLIAPVTAVYLLMVVVQREWRVLRRALATVILGGVFAAPFILPLLLDRSIPQGEGAVTYSASLLGIVSPSFYHPLFNQWEYNRRVLGVDPFEQASYVGLVAALLALVAVWKFRAARWWLLLALVAWVFSLGPLLKLYDEPLALRVGGYATHVSLPWALFQNLPLVNSARTPARFNFAVGFALALLVGCGAAHLWAKIKWRRIRWAVLALLLAAIIFEYQFWWGLPTIPGEVPAPIAALSSRDDLRAVLDIPGYHPLTNKDGMFLQTGHGLPMIVGQIARESPANPAKVWLLQGTLDPALLDAAEVDIVILHKEFDGEDGEFGALARDRFGAPFYEDAQYAVFEVPPYTSDPPDFVSYIDGSTLYFYAPEAGTGTLTGQVVGDGGAQASLDGVLVIQWAVREAQNLRVPISFPAGYHAISISNDPACPELTDPALRCPPLNVEGLELVVSS